MHERQSSDITLYSCLRAVASPQLVYTILLTQNTTLWGGIGLEERKRISQSQRLGLHTVRT